MRHDTAFVTGMPSLRWMAIWLALTLFAPTPSPAAVTANVASNQLTIVITDGDDVTLTCAGGSVKINGADPNSGAFACASLTEIIITGDDEPGGNIINLSSVFTADFSSVTQVTVNAGGGDDTIAASQLKDLLRGGAGDDHYVFPILWGQDVIEEEEGGGNDTISFELVTNSLTVLLDGLSVFDSFGNTLIDENRQVENFTGGSGDDTYIFETNGSQLSGNPGTLDGFDGVDTLIYKEWTSPIYVDLMNATATGLGEIFFVTHVTAGDGHDELWGLDGSILTGNGGDDYFGGGMGSVTMIGGPGNDTYAFDFSILNNGSALIVEDSDCVDIDWLDFFNFGLPVTVDLALTTPQVIVEGSLVITLSSSTAIEGIVGSDHGDTLFGNACNNQFRGLKGDDHLAGREGDDTYLLFSDWGADVIDELPMQGYDEARIAVSGNLNVLIGEEVVITTRPDNGVDSLSIPANQVELIVLPDGDDHVIFDDGGQLAGGLGRIEANGGENWLDYRNYATPVTINLSDFITTPTTGLASHEGFDYAIGGQSNDILVGNYLPNILIGGPGNDILFGDISAIIVPTYRPSGIRVSGVFDEDILIGGPGDDILAGGNDDDILIGGPGDDVYIFEESWGMDDLIEDFDSGNDTVDLTRVDFPVRIYYNSPYVDNAAVLAQALPPGPSGALIISPETYPERYLLGPKADEFILRPIRSDDASNLHYNGGDGDDLLLAMGHYDATVELDSAISGGMLTLGASTITFENVSQVDVLKATSLTYRTNDGPNMTTLDNPSSGTGRLITLSGGDSVPELHFADVPHLVIDHATNDVSTADQVSLAGGSGGFNQASQGPASLMFIHNVAESEPNDTVAQGNALPSAVQSAIGAINPVGDQDVWSSAADMGDRLFVLVDASLTSPSADPYLRVIANDGVTVIEENDDSGPGQSALVAGAVVPQAGNIHLIVSEDGGDAPIEHYTLYQVVLDPLVFSAGSDDNDTTQTATPLNFIFIGDEFHAESQMLHVRGDVPPASGDVDFYRFHAPVGYQIVVMVDENPNRDSFRTHTIITLFDSDGETILAQGDNLVSRMGNALGPVGPLAHGGPYFLRVADGGFTIGASSDYHFVVAAFDTGRRLETIDVLAGAGADSVSITLPFHVAGGETFQISLGGGEDTLTIEGTDADDNFQITASQTTLPGHTFKYDTQLEHIIINAGAGDDTFSTTASPWADFLFLGGSQTVGDTLMVDAQGSPASHTPPASAASVANGAEEGPLPQGRVKVAGHKQILYQDIESVDVINVGDWLDAYIIY